LVDWDYYNKFDEVNNKYLPPMGEGDTMATQIVTVINKLVYKWYNDGDVYDNTHGMTGWWNDLSSYANWLVKLPEFAPILYGIMGCYSDSQYEDLLKRLADLGLDETFLSSYNIPKEGTIYKCDGPFKFEECADEEDDYYSDYDEGEDDDEDDEEYD
jgi:hypothetical protein